MEETVRDLILRRQARVCVMGLGYAGLPLAVEFARAGFEVVGFDVDEGVVAGLNNGASHVADVDSALIGETRRSNRFSASVDDRVLATSDVVVVCVPTPLSKTKDPDISHVLDAVERVARYLRPGQLVVLESTTYPGTTQELLAGKLQGSGLEVGRDFFLAFSPERVDPGNKVYTTKNTPKVVGGVTSRCLGLATALYESVIDTIVPVSSPTVAELSKLLENMFRAVNIALANELAQMARVLDVDVWEVIEAASTKPFGFMPFYPGPGLGGHCIPIDPEFLAWKLRALNYGARFVQLAREVNGEMPGFVVDLISEALNENRKCLNGAEILVLGVAYKQDSADVRESPALELMSRLLERQAVVRYADSHVRSVDIEGLRVPGTPLSLEELRRADCVVIVTAHSDVDYDWVALNADLVVDTRNATNLARENVWRLGRPRRDSTASSGELYRVGA